MFRIICFFILFLPFITESQSNLFSEKDTVKFTNRTGGELDSIDMTYSSNLSTFSGGALNIPNSTISIPFIKSNTGLQNFRTTSTFKDLRFSGMPHLGFSYSFGSKGTQFLHFDYQHALSKNVLLNLNYIKNSSNGFLRNSKFSDNTIDVQVRKNGKFYSSIFQGLYTNRVTALNGGVDNFTNIDNGLEDLTVKTSTSNSIIKLADVGLKNYFNLLNDSLKAIGLVTKHNYQATNREYVNSDYDSLSNIDKFKTRDQYRFASIANSAGIYLKSKLVFLDFLVLHKYWDYQNLGKHKEVSEVNLTSSLEFKSEKIDLRNSLNSNIIGAGGEWSNTTQLTTKFRQLNLKSGMQIEQKWPDAFQRHYFSNSTSYTLQNYKLQSRLNSNLAIQYSIKNTNFIQVSISNLRLLNNYFYSGDRWNNDTLKNVNINSISLNGSVRFGVFILQPKLTLNSTSKNFNFIPSTIFNTRLFVKKKMFKAKKMEGIVGVDFSWISTYKLMGYNYQMDVFTTQNTVFNFDPMSNLSLFFGFSIGEFRFFTRYENIGYFWNNQVNQVLIGYPIQKNFIRLGITWDFFN